MNSVKSILIAGLKAMGADGLTNGFLECACGLDDLSPVGCLSEDECLAARFVPPKKDWPDGYYTPMGAP